MSKSSPSPPDPAAVAGAWGLGTATDPPTFAARGELGRIWSLATDRGRWAVKELWFPPSEAAAREDVAFQLTAWTAGIPMPEPKLRPNGDVLAILPAADGQPLTVRVYAWAELTPVVPEPRVAGGLLARLHGLATPTDAPAQPWYREPVGQDRWNELAEQAEAAEARWAAGVRALVPEMVALEAWLVAAGEPRPLVRCHLDFCPDNVLSDPAGEPVVIDWENSGPESPEREVAVAAIDFGGTDDGAVARFVEGYAAAGGPARLRDRTDFATAIAVQGHLLETYARWAMAPESSAEDRERCAWRIETILAAPVTRRRIDALVELLRTA